MRWLIGDSLENGEDGATAVIVAILLVVLFGAGALVLDVGSLFWERRQLQNGADAAAFALVQECMDEGLPCGGTASNAASIARSYADANAADGIADASVTFDATTCLADVTTSTLEAQGGVLVPPVLAKVIVAGYEGTTVSARAVAECGGIAAGEGLPLIFNQQVWHDVTKVQKPDGAPADWWKTWSPSGGGATGDIFFNQGGNAADYGPGAFGWLPLDAGEACQASITSLGTVGSAPGNNFSCSFTNAAPQNAQQFQNHILGNNPHLVPMYSSYGGGGSNLTYQVSGFAVIYITGWHFSGNHYQYNAPCSGNDRCISGHFLHTITLNEFEAGGSDFGVYSYRLVE